MADISSKHTATPRSSKWRKQLSFESDEEYSSFSLKEKTEQNEDSKLRTRLFDDEESRDSGLGMDDHLGDDLSFDLTIRRFAIFSSENTDESRDTDKVTCLTSDNVPRCNVSQKRVRPKSTQETSPVQQKRQRRNSFTAALEYRQRGSHPCSKANGAFAALMLTEGPLMRPVPNPTLYNCGTEDDALSGDNSRELILPTIAGKHQDLKSVTPDTLAGVLKLEYSAFLGEAVIVDCRYPYEYEGGHIKGAINCYTKDSVMERFLSNEESTVVNNNKRSILIFHCEFSSERAPKLSRFLREMDRKANQWCYPQLNYPEIYLLHGGYKNFFEQYKELCTPPCYIPMHHTDHKADLRKFRVKSKSWAGDKKTRSVFGL